MKYDEVTIQSKEVNEAAAEYGMSRQDMASLLGISDKTYYNLMKAGKLDLNQSDRFNFIHDILEEGKHTFNGLANFKDWLHTEQSSLGGHTPLAKMATLVGAQEVLSEMIRTRHGIFA